MINKFNLKKLTKELINTKIKLEFYKNKFNVNSLYLND